MEAGRCDGHSNTSLTPPHAPWLQLRRAGRGAQIEALDDVERCFVHVDYQTRDEPEHKVERGLSIKAAADLTKAAAAASAGEPTTQLQDLRED